LLEAGDVAGANALLGYNYFAEGKVIPGKRLGRTIGFPTLNLAWAPDLRPRFGVYRVQVRGQAVNRELQSTGNNHSRPDPLPGVANYGLRPTLEQTSVPQLETHLFGQCPFDAGDFIIVEWLRFLRPEKKFASLDELRAQIARDVEAAQGLGSGTAKAVGGL
jgi:riboflavin kinase/FMN adenylyltransferase